MNRIRLLPVVVLAISALLVLKTLGLVTNGGYVLVGASPVQAAGGGGGSHGEAGGVVTESDATLTFPDEPTLEDTAPTVTDTAPTLGATAAAEAGHGEGTATSHGGAGEVASADAESAEAAVPTDGGAPNPLLGVSETFCRDVDVTVTESGRPTESPAEEAGEHGEDSQAEQTEPALLTTDCLPSGDAVPLQVTSNGTVQPLIAADGTSPTEQQILQRLANRRAELEKYEQDLALRSSLVDAAEKRIEERATTLEAVEAQIASLVDQREQMETGQFAAIVAMYEVMKPKDAAKIFNNLDMEVLVRVSKAMQPRKMAPILAEMDAARAQELTVRMAALADQPVTQMAPEDLAALPQIVGQ
ncbi:MotE family protein [Devosia albogilva]|uniref:MotE family protein n=1 Tax=Devosia albogilva TaxID=429726 RepID=A0ABW5QGT3_9HYPH